ncbi:tyrosine-protein kinase [Pseudomonas saudimassiliensis]|uniref:Tyrosine-protein kinase n=1 Tax=Pseudomonas saudimassiliensis TaxID=1461581 RepID=A0A078MG54_9PSED|nr:polysaccharide biosynthesis tyrosine autokinase [Pseudomonas saudimassiliensis]CEA06298.1 tyrosine-protein kinase [Pseudomonas saudimassiliensis]CEF27723.1 tyrosine-protein kinase [Pseudomonas saudimassiliensis]
MQNTPAVAPQKTSDEIDLLALLGALLDNKGTIIACTLVFALFGIAYALLSTPVYQANGMIQIEEKSSGVGSLLGDSELFATASPAVTEIELLKSRQVIGQAVDNLKLTIVAQPNLFPVIGAFVSRRFQPEPEQPVAAPFLGFDRFAWGGEKLDIFQLEVPDAYLGKPLVLVSGENGAYRLLNEDGQELVNGTVGEAVDSDGFKVQIAELVARPGTEFNVVKRGRLSTILGLQRSISASEKGKDSGIMSISMQHTKPAYAMAVLDEVSRLYVRQNVERKSAEAQQSLEFLTDQLPKVRKDLEQAENALNAYQATSGSVDITIETQSILEQVVELEAAISELTLKREELQRRFTRDHPSYQALISQMGQLEGRRDRLLEEVGGLPETQQELLRLARDVQVSTEIYTQMLNKSQELDVMRAGTVGNVRIIDEAAVDTSQPVKPKKPLIVVLATLLGGMLGVAIALLRHALNRGIENPELIEQIGLPVYASVPFSKDQEVLERTFKGKPGHAQSSNLLAATNPADLSIEALRSLRTSLHFAMMEAKNNIIMISGPSPGVGKSFVSANLAAIIAQTGQRVALIDADMRKGYLHKLVNINPEPGLSGLLVHTHTLADVVHKTEVENLHFISRGTIPPNPSELLMHSNFQTVLDQLSKMYDLVIVDTPPILAVTDAALVGRLAGTSLIVTRFGLNPVKEVELTLQRFRNNGIEIKGAIFNAVEKKSAAYGYGDYGYYQYEYKSDAK